jgi:putative DNA primase/helicase
MLTQKHLEEFKKSGIPAEIAESIFESTSDTKKIADFLGWQGYKGPPGWLYEGIDPITGQRTGIGQFKPDGGIVFPNGDQAKYLSQKDSNGKGKYDACCIPIPGIDWQDVATDIEQLIRCVEGVKKSACSMIHTSVATVALSGVDMATYGRGGKLTPTLEKLCVPGRRTEIAYDSDIIEKEGVRSAAIAFGRSLKKAGCHVQVRLWPQELGKGLDDAIENVGVEEFERQSTILDFDEWVKSVKKLKEVVPTSDENYEDEDEIPKKKPPAHSVIAKAIAENYKDTLAWRPAYKKWYRYGSELEGLWSKNDEEFINRLISIELSARGIEHSANYLAGVIKLLKAFLAIKDWDASPGLLPAKNGVINLKTLKISPHSPTYKLTWQLPYEYDAKASCEPIINWMLEATKGNESLVELLRAYLYSIIYGRTDIHRYLEIWGPSGSGKTTFMKLATMLVGNRNTHITKLKKLEGQFETAALLDKKLVLITDSDRYGGTVETLRAITGGDRVPYEEKFLQPDEGFQPGCKVIISCNEPIQAQDYIALERRRITVPFDNKISVEKQRVLIEEVNGEIVGEFANYLPGLLNWVLTTSQEAAEKYLKKTEQMVSGYKRIALQAIVNSNPIADWADQHLIFKEGARLQVGVAQRSKDSNSSNSYLNISSWMYASYAEFCATTGTHLLSLKRFVMLANDLFTNQLKLNVRHARDRVSAFFENLKLRSEMDDCPGLFSGQEPGPQPPEPGPQPPEPGPQLSEPGPQPPEPGPQLSEPGPQPPEPGPQPPEPKWNTFPSAGTDSNDTRKNKALACCNQLIKAMAIAKCRKDLAPLRNRWTKSEVSWVATNLFTPEQARRLQAILATDQKELDL